MRALGACLIFKDAAPYLREWIQFHLAVGVEHFYLYDNDSTDDFGGVLQPFLAQKIITLHRWPGVGQQSAVYEHCLQTYRGAVRWLAFLDDDEFLLPVKDAAVPRAASKNGAPSMPITMRSKTNARFVSWAVEKQKAPPPAPLRRW